MFPITCVSFVCNNRRTTQHLGWLHVLLIRVLLILRHQTCIRLHVWNVRVPMCVRHPTSPHIFCLTRPPCQARRRTTLLRPLSSWLPLSPLLCYIRHWTCPLLHRTYLLSGVHYTTSQAPPALHRLQKFFLTALVYRAASKSQRLSPTEPCAMAIFGVLSEPYNLQDDLLVPPMEAGMTESHQK
jgi:hypothetical protein